VLLRARAQMSRARACSRCSACRSQLVSLPASELGNKSASPRVIIDDLVSVCGFGANEQARDLEYDSHTAMVYISTQQCVKPHHPNRFPVLFTAASCPYAAPLRYDDSHPFDLGHAAYALGPLSSSRDTAPVCSRLTFFTGDYDMVAQASVAIARA